jgi:hypothetical protein
MAKEPTFLQGLLGSAVPLVVAIAIAIIATALFYTFWYGFDWLANWLF